MNIVGIFLQVIEDGPIPALHGMVRCRLIDLIH
jgi:hypothetical protein